MTSSMTYIQQLGGNILFDFDFSAHWFRVSFFREDSVRSFMSILVILTPPCKTHLPTADHSATPIGNSVDPYGRIDSQDTGMHVQQTTKFTKHDASTVMQLRPSWAVRKHGNLASTFQISIVRIFCQLFSSLYQGRSWARLV